MLPQSILLLFFTRETQSQSGTCAVGSVPLGLTGATSGRFTSHNPLHYVVILKVESSCWKWKFLWCLVLSHHAIVPVWAHVLCGALQQQQKKEIWVNRSRCWVICGLDTCSNRQVVADSLWQEVPRFTAGCVIPTPQGQSGAWCIFADGKFCTRSVSDVERAGELYVSWKQNRKAIGRCHFVMPHESRCWDGSTKLDLWSGWGGH